jgi:hypothetical protein
MGRLSLAVGCLHHDGAQDAMDEELAGAPVIIIWHRTLTWAVDELTKLGKAELTHLKVRSGEHLAAILATSFLGVAPAQVDTSGGVDLLFHLPEEEGRPLSSLLLPTIRRAAFEIKSMPGPFRELDSRINRIHRTGGSSVGLGIKGTVRTALDILEEARPVLASAQAGLKSKVPASDCTSRNIFLVVHPFDALAVELKHPVLGPLLPDMDDLHEIDYVWVLWVPEHLTLWSKRERGWTDLIFWATNPDEDVSSELPILQAAELRFLDARGDEGLSPYMFMINEWTYDSD